MTVSQTTPAVAAPAAATVANPVYQVNALVWRSPVAATVTPATALFLLRCLPGTRRKREHNAQMSRGQPGGFVRSTEETLTPRSKSPTDSLESSAFVWSCAAAPSCCGGWYIGDSRGANVLRKCGLPSTVPLIPHPAGKAAEVYGRDPGASNTAGEPLQAFEKVLAGSEPPFAPGPSKTKPEARGRGRGRGRGQTRGPGPA
ncbi:unnamed protein product [Symbiodinium sp. CCMP2456]|nr:unnamed protein product [Symbiodinium sp. CCMP2456]